MNVRLSGWDYLVVILGLVVCLAAGLLAGRRSSGGVSQYLLAGRDMSILPVSFSIMATILSAITMAGGVGEMYLYGAQYQLVSLAGIFTKIGVAFLIVPVFHKMEYTSIYEYLEKRFDRSLRLLFSFLYILCNIPYLGIVLYMPAISLTTVTGIPFWATSTVTGITCVIYCVFGGFKAVIWTDIVQALLMFSCISLVFAKGLLNYGSFADAWDTAYQGGMLSFTWSEDISKRYSVWSLCACGFILSLKDYTVNQAGVQRLLSVRNADAARRSVYLSGFLMLTFKIVLVLVGVIVYANFSRCDPLSYQESGVKSLDQVFIFSIWKFLEDVPGLTGLAFSGIISGSLSTYSSYINAFAAITLEDYLKPLCPKLTDTEKNNIFICKLLTGVYGLIPILLSFGVPYVGGATKFHSTFVIASGGPLCGVMCLGFFVAKANSRVSKIALVSGVLPCLWIAIGAQIFPTTYSRLPFGTENCPENLTLYIPRGPVFNSAENSYDLPLYHISFMWYGFIGFGVTMIVGWLLSFIIGNEESANPMFLSPIVCKRQTKKENYKLAPVEVEELRI